MNLLKLIAVGVILLALPGCPKEPTVTEMPIKTTEEAEPGTQKRTLSLPLKAEVECKADQDCALLALELNDQGAAGACCYGCGSIAVNAEWAVEAEAFCKENRRGCAKVRCDVEEVVAKCVNQVCTTLLVNDVQFPKQVMQCKTAVDCALTRLDTTTEGQRCCQRCPPGEAVAASWAKDVANICEAVDTSTCPKRKCKKVGPMQPDCVDGACVVVPAK